MALLFFACNGHTGEKHLSEDKGVKIRGGEEILIARSITNYSPFWCGSSGRLIYVSGDYQITSYDIKTGKRLNIAGIWNAPVGCTPDGKWLIYEDTDSVRFEKGNVENVVGDFWRYEFKTGMRHKFVIADNRAGHLSPRGLKLYLGRRPAERIPMPEPHWDIPWSEGRGRGSVWLSDGSAIIGIYRDFERRRDVLEVEVFTPEKKVFSITPPFQSFSLLMVDKQNRLYIGVENQSGVYIANKGKDQRLLRCGVDLKMETLSCETILKPWDTSSNIDVFYDGETMVFSKWKEYDCVRIMKVSEQEGRCLTPTGLPVWHDVVISPDERWLAFERARHINDKNFDSDLYIVELKTE